MCWTDGLRTLVELAAQRALGEQDSNPYSKTSGCFDRRYWAWKLVDFPESTFQRLVLPLAVLYRDPLSRYYGQPEVLGAVRAGLAYAGRTQHANGSFDQAFPFEQSYGATAFLLFPLLEASRLVDEYLGADERAHVERTAGRAARFLAEHDEHHGIISNHLAGAGVALAAAADRFHDVRFGAVADALIDRVVRLQSPEGWFPEYGGPDPGYQTLCIDYLSDFSARRSSAKLDAALDKAVDFLQWFVHPDGTFGGLYGSRRTSLVYLAGLARLASRNPVAAALCEATGAAMARTDVAGPSTVDIGNLAPVFTSTVRSLGHAEAGIGAKSILPCDAPAAACDFVEAGLHVRGTRRYYAVVGASNGGTLTVFNRESRKLVLDDGGYVAALTDGTLATTQVSHHSAQRHVEQARVEIEVSFFRMPTAVPTPGRFLLFRLLNLTAMRNVAVGNWVKRRLVGLLMAAGRRVSLRLVRRITFGDDSVCVDDRIENPEGLALRSLTGGQPFSAIHMASAGYFHAARLGSAVPASVVDVDVLTRDRVVNLRRRVS